MEGRSPRKQARVRAFSQSQPSPRPYPCVNRSMKSFGVIKGKSPIPRSPNGEWDHEPSHGTFPLKIATNLSEIRKRNWIHFAGPFKPGDITRIRPNITTGSHIICTENLKMAYRIFVRRFGRKTINIKYSILCASEFATFSCFYGQDTRE